MPAHILKYRTYLEKEEGAEGKREVFICQQSGKKNL